MNPPRGVARALQLWQDMSNPGQLPSDKSSTGSEDRSKAADRDFPEPPNEQLRLAALRSFEILDTDQEDAEFDNLTQLTASIMDTPLSLVSILDDCRQWFKSHHGTDFKSTDKSAAFCVYAIMPEADSVTVVLDTAKDPRFVNNPMVVGPPFVKFYAGAPVYLDEEQTIAAGTLCIADTVPHTGFSEEAKQNLVRLASVCSNMIKAHKQKLAQMRSRVGLTLENNLVLAAVDSMSVGSLICDATQQHHPILYASASAASTLNVSRDELVGRALADAIGGPGGPNCAELRGLRMAVQMRQHARSTMQCYRRTVVGEIGTGTSTPQEFWATVSVSPLYLNDSVTKESSDDMGTGARSPEISTKGTAFAAIEINRVLGRNAEVVEHRNKLSIALQTVATSLIGVAVKARGPLEKVVNVSKEIRGGPSSSVEQLAGAQVLYDEVAQIANMLDNVVVTTHDAVKKCDMPAYVLTNGVDDSVPYVGAGAGGIAVSPSVVCTKRTRK